MIRCPICSSYNTHRLKIIDKTQIYECNDCKTALIPKNKKLITKTIYNFKKYDIQKDRYKKRFEDLVKEIYTYRKSGTILDVGAGFGLFSSILKKKGDFKIELLEPILKIKYIDNVPVYKTTFEKFLKTNKKKYHIIILLDVLEHFKDPKTILTNIHKILHKKGLIVIQTPNYRSLMARITNNWAWWMPEDHKLVFSSESLNRLLNNCNYSTLMNRTYESFYEFKKNLDGNFLKINNALVRKLSKFLFLVCFIPIYYICRPILWNVI